MKFAKIFNFSTIDFDTEAGLTIHLGELEDMRLYQKVRVDVNVLTVNELVTFPSGMKDITVAITQLPTLFFGK